MGKTVIVTGASQGIGRATAIRMASEPTVSTVVLIARSAAGLEETAAAIGPGDAQVRCLPYDLADLDGIPGLVAGIYDEFGGLDVLLNIAGYAEPKALLDTTSQNLVTTFTINVFAMMLLTREFVRFAQGHPAFEMVRGG